MENYLFFFVLVMIMLTIYGAVKYRNIVNPITLFCGLWTVILFAYLLHLFGLYDAVDAVLWSVVIGVVMFFLGCELKSIMVGRNVFLVEDIQVKNTPNYTLMTIINFLSISILLGYAVVTIKMLLNGISYEYIHVMYQSEEGIVGSFKYGIRLWHYFVWPWNLCTIPLVVSCFILDKKDNKNRRLFIISSFVNIGLYILISGARVSLAYFVFYFFVIILLKRNTIKLGIWQKVLIISLAFVAWVVFDYLSKSRNSASLENTIYTYLCGCIPYYSYRLNIFNNTARGYMYGLHSLSGILKPFFAISGKAFGKSGIWMQVLNDLETQGRTYIAPHNPFNAFSSLFYCFYMDGGLIAVAILSFIYGFFAMSVYSGFMKKMTYKNLVLYLLTAFGLAFSMVRFHFITIRYILAFFYVMVCFSRVKITIRRKE